MDQRLRWIERSRGFFTRADARDCGYDDKTMAALLRGRVWHRVRHGAYCFDDLWETLGPEARHLVVAKAVLAAMDGRVALSHTSALIASGIAVWGVPLDRVHVTRLDAGAGRVERDVHHHLGRCCDDDLVEVGGLLVTAPTRAVLETATLTSVESGLVSADSALHARLTDPDRLTAKLAEMQQWRGARKVQLVTRMSDGRAESVGESRSRYLFWTQGLPAPDLQFPVYDERGMLVALMDFAWPEHRVFGEFDGRVKYLRLLRPGETPSEAVVREKDRENLVRRLTGFIGGRIDWRDLSTPRATGDRFRQLLRIAA